MENLLVTVKLKGNSDYQKLSPMPRIDPSLAFYFSDFVQRQITVFLVKHLI